MQLIAIITDKVIYTIRHPLLENTPTAEIIMRNQNVVCRFEIGNQFLPIPRHADHQKTPDEYGGPIEKISTWAPSHAHIPIMTRY